VLSAAVDRVKRAVSAKHYQIYDLYAVKQWPISKVTKVMKVSDDLVYQVKSRISRQIQDQVEQMKTKLI
jgi:hypothetical protein